MSVVEQIANKLSHSFRLIPEKYYNFCFIAYYVIGEGEDMNALLDLVNNLSDYTVSTKTAVDTFSENCASEHLVNNLQEIYREHMQNYQRIRNELDNQPRVAFEEGECQPEWL